MVITKSESTARWGVPDEAASQNNQSFACRFYEIASSPLRGFSISQPLRCLFQAVVSVEEVRRQHNEIDRLNSKLKGFYVFKGIESDILADGSLDYPKEILEMFDFVIASVHSRFTMPEDEMTKRIINAIKNPYTTILGHPTGRLLLAREPYNVNLKEVLKAAKDHGVVVELNSNPQRLDLDWRWCKVAREMGIKIVIGPDAHNIDGIADVSFGVDIARKGWLGPEDVINTLDVEEMKRFLKKAKVQETQVLRTWSPLGDRLVQFLERYSSFLNLDKLFELKYGRRS